MVETVRQAPGVGLAAPQVGVGLRVVVVETPADAEGDGAPGGLFTLANPEIVWADEAVEEAQEACLSVPDLYGDVPRHVAVRVRGLNAAGKPVDIAASGFVARVFQHELDHLDGRLFTDRVISIDKLYSIRQEGDDAVRVPFASPETL
jgi:peptide deformylase